MSATEARGKLVVDITTPLHVQETAKGRAQGGTVSKLRQWYFLPLFLTTAFRLHLSPLVDKAISSLFLCANGTQAVRGIGATHKGQCKRLLTSPVSPSTERCAHCYASQGSTRSQSTALCSPKWV